MSKSFKWKNHFFNDTTSIVHNKELLSVYLDNFKKRIDDYQDAYWIAYVKATDTNLAGNKSHVWSDMTTYKSKNITYTSNIVTFKTSGLYYIHCFVHLQGGITRSFVQAEFKNCGDLCPTTARSTDTQSMSAGGTDPCYEMNKIVAIKAGGTMTLQIWANTTFALMGSTSWSSSASGFTVFKIGEYPS